MILREGQGWTLNPSLLESSFNPDLLAPTTVAPTYFVTVYNPVLRRRRSVSFLN